MKKTYIQPQAAVYGLEPQQVLASSGGTELPLYFKEGEVPEDDNEVMW